MKTIIKLTNEYASNLNCLFFNFNNSLASYYDMFDFIFNDCLLSDDIDIAQYTYFKMIDIVFIKIDDDSKFKNHEEIKNFIRSLRRDHELLPVYLIKDNIKNTKVVEMIDECYCLDGMVPTPFDRNMVYRFLYRVLKRLIVEKELNAYILDLENQLYTPLDNDKEDKHALKKPTKEIKTVNKEREKDIRFSQTDKISALEFMSSLDDTIVDKLENLSEELDSLIGILYDIDAANTQDALVLMSTVNSIIEEIYILVDSIGAFAVTARAFETLNRFLASLSVVELSDLDKKSMLVAMLLAIINDLEKWINVIFVNQTTEDIHYLDASFSSNILEVENLFLDDSDDDDDDDDLEFF